ncbi:MAG TPA: hypothetical protein VLI39_18760 [Sedimentisphaerales bacterium]|nr:hypothetical protein [Sedimentisphaerales bacterium]
MPEFPGGLKDANVKIRRIAGFASGGHSAEGLPSTRSAVGVRVSGYRRFQGPGN